VRPLKDIDSASPITSRREISLRDFVLSGGEARGPGDCRCHSTTAPGRCPIRESARTDSFFGRGLERAELHKASRISGPRVPVFLISGDHARIERWRSDESARLTAEAAIDRDESTDKTRQ